MCLFCCRMQQTISAKNRSSQIRNFRPLFKNWANPGLLFVYFHPFLIAKKTITVSISTIRINWRQHGLFGIRTHPEQDGRRRRNHGAMTSAPIFDLFRTFFFGQISPLPVYTSFSSNVYWSIACCWIMQLSIKWTSPHVNELFICCCRCCM